MTKTKTHIYQSWERCYGAKSVPAEHLQWIAQGAAMRKARLAKGYGLREYADLIGMLPSEYCAMENGRIQPR